MCVRLERRLLLLLLHWLLQWVSLMVRMRLLLVWWMQLVAAILWKVLSEHGVVRRALNDWSTAKGVDRGDAL